MTAAIASTGTDELGQRPAGEDLADQPAQQAEPGDAQADGEKADGDGAGDAGAHALGEDQETRFDVHENDSKSNSNIRHSTNRKGRCTNLNMNMDANWDDLRVFLTLAREGTLTTAARALGVSHPTVSRRVQALERQIGARLFERLPDRFVPTSAGEELLADTEAMEKAALSIHRRSAGLSDTVSGVVRLSAGEAMAALVARHLPGLRARLRADRVRGDRQPHAGQPVAPRGRPPDPRAGARSRRHRRAQARPRGLRGLRRARPRPSSRKAALEGAAVDRLRRRPRLHAGPAMAACSGWAARGPAIRGNNWLVLHEAARAGAGLAVLPCYLGDPDPALQARRRDHRGGRSPTQWLLVHRDLRALPRVRAVMDAVVELFQRERPLLEGRA